MQSVTSFIPQNYFLFSISCPNVSRASISNRFLRRTVRFLHVIHVCYDYNAAGVRKMGVIKLKAQHERCSFLFWQLNRLTLVFSVQVLSNFRYQSSELSLVHSSPATMQKQMQVDFIIVFQLHTACYMKA